MGATGRLLLDLTSNAKLPTEVQSTGTHSRLARESHSSHAARSRSDLRRSSSASGYMVAATAMAAALFFLLWWMLQDEETPWVPAGLAASVVMLVAAFARILVARKARAQFRATDSESYSPHSSRIRSSAMKSTSRHAAALRALQKQSAAADANDSPERHRELYELCSEYLAGAERALQSPSLQADGR